MSLVHYAPWFDSESAFDNFFAPSRLVSGAQSSWLSPKVDILECDNHYEISAELPGLKKEDVNISLHDGILAIEANSTSKKTEEKEGKIIRKERHSGSYLRRFDLGSEIRDDAIMASFNDGLLNIKVAKPEPEAPQPKRIDIN